MFVLRICVKILIIFFHTGYKILNVFLRGKIERNVAFSGNIAVFPDIDFKIIISNWWTSCLALHITYSSELNGDANKEA